MMRAYAWVRRNAGRIVALVLMLCLLPMFLGPFVWAFFSSFKGAWEIVQYPPTLLPSVWHPENYVDVFREAPFARYILNTLRLALFDVTGTVLSAALVGYAFARFRWPGRSFFFMLAMGTMMLPREVTTIPTYILFSKIHWLDTYYPLVVPSWFGGGAFMIFIFRQYLMTLPRELDEAAYMDGAGPFLVFRSVLLPLCRPAIATAIVISFIGVWKDFWGPFIYLSSRVNYTVSLGLRLFAWSARGNISLAGDPTEHWLMTASMISIVPCLLIFVAAQQYFVQGIVTTGLKGV